MNANMDYSFLFEQMFGKKNTSMPMAAIPLSNLSNKSVQSQLRAAGIDTNSKQYKAVIGSMMKATNGGMAYTNIQAIKNRMSRYDKDGDYIDPVTGVAGLEVNEKTIATKNRIVSIPESSREEMFQLTKKEFLRENGIANGDTTKRSDVYFKMYPQIAKKDRLAAGHTLEQYERAYTRAFVDAVKAIDPKWEAGKPIPPGALDGITRESIESQLVKSGSSLVKRSSVSGRSIDVIL